MQKTKVQNRLRIEEVALFVGVSVNTVNSWYRFKREEPDNEYAKLLPDYKQDGGDRSTRYWTSEDIEKFLEFKQKRPIGKNGVMGMITQKYVKKENK